MPANLTPQYQKAEEEYRRAQSAQEEVECLQRLLQLIPKHKGTEKLQADLKTRLKEAKGSAETEAKTPKKGRKSYRFPRQGAAQIILIGAPNAGKSRLLAELTHATPEVAPYPFATREPLPGMMRWDDVDIQLIDTPPITLTQFEPYLTGMVRSADMVLLAFDGSSDEAPEQTSDVVRQLAARKTVLARDSGFAEDDLSTVRVKTLLIVTRGNAPSSGDRLQCFQELVPRELPAIQVELDDLPSRELLRGEIYRKLDMIRVYTKKPGCPAELEHPYTIAAGGTIEDLAIKVHREIAEKLKFGKVWGTSARDGQSCGREHPLHDKDVVELHW